MGVSIMTPQEQIEALTAERDDWKKRHFKMRDERDTQAIAAKNYADFNHEWRKRAEKAEADNARLRGLLSEADKRLAWESLGFGNDFADRVEAALSGKDET